MNQLISFLFTGDLAPCRRFEPIVIARGKTVFGDLENDIASADLAFVNLETPLCVSSHPITKSGPNIKAHPDCVKAIADAGFDIIGLANNHIMDYGVDGLSETLDVCRKYKMAVCGAGYNLSEAQKIEILYKKGLKIAFIAVAEHEFSIAANDKAGAAPLDPIDNFTQIKTARALADLVFITIHGGNEYFEYPRPGLKKLCRHYVDIGADAVICHHPHVPGVFELYNDKPIVYSLGNLLFDHHNPPDGWNEGYVLALQYDVDSKKSIQHEIIPYTQSVQQGGLKKLQDREKSDFLDRLKEYYNIFSDDNAYKKAWMNFCESKRNHYLMKMFMPLKFRGMFKLSKMIPLLNLAMPNSTISGRTNILRCDSHRELLLHLLEEPL